MREYSIKFLVVTALFIGSFACSSEERSLPSSPASDGAVGVELTAVEMNANTSRRLNRDIKCSDDGRVCLECFYKDNGELLYCDVWILPAAQSPVRDIANPLRGKFKAIKSRQSSLLQ